MDKKFGITQKLSEVETSINEDHKLWSCFQSKKKSNSKYNNKSRTEFSEKTSFKKILFTFIEKISKSTYYEYFVLKATGGAALGVALGYTYYELVLKPAFEFEDDAGLSLLNILFWILILVSSASCALSVKVRCIVMLCVPTLLSGTGRKIYKAVLISWVLGGKFLRSVCC